MNSFLLSLPAILGVTVYVIYLFIRKSIAEDPTVSKIIDKLEFKESNFAERWTNLTPKQKTGLLKDDNEIRERISTKDRQILDKIITQHYRTNIFVYALCAILVIVGVYLFIKPKELVIGGISLLNGHVSPKEILVDIDPVIVTWTYSGVNEEVNVTLENIQTGKETKPIRALASDSKVIFRPNPYDNFEKILSERTPNETNRVRAIIRSKNGTFQSDSYDIKVGVTVICYPEQPNKLIFNAIVDQRIVDNFHFSPSIALFTDKHFNGSTIYEAREFTSRPEIVVPDISKFVSTNFEVAVHPKSTINQDIYKTDEEGIKVAIKELQDPGLKSTF